MLSYKLNDGYGSEYESDGGTPYQYEQDLGQGSFSKARLFSSPKNHKKKAVIAPNDKRFFIDSKELQAKYTFYQTLYPLEGVNLFLWNSTYRLITPFIQGAAYNQFFIPNENGLIKLFLAAVMALKNCHDKGLIVLDLKEDNIHYDPDTKTSYLIDGGLSVKKDLNIRPDIFQQRTSIDIFEHRKKYFFIAPECWSVDKEPAKATMDIYSLGNMMNRLKKITISSSLQRLINQCQNIDPSSRPSLDNIQITLKALQLINKTSQSIEEIDVDFTKQSTPEAVEIHKNLLFTQIDEQLKNNEYINALKIAGFTTTPTTLTHTIKMIKNDIIEQANNTIIEINELYLSAIDRSLTSLHNKIETMEEKHHACQAQQQAKQLLETLTSIREKYSLNLNNADAKKQCQQDYIQAINKARPILENDLNWGDYLDNLNNENTVDGFGKYTRSFFNLTKSDALTTDEPVNDEIINGLTQLQL